jgi:hypothetical protein
MKKIFYLLLAILLVLTFVYIVQTKRSSIIIEDPAEEVIVKEPISLCFVKFGEKQVSGFYDKFTLRMSLDNENKTVKGYLKILPAEKDGAVGSYEGSVSDVDPYAMARTIDAVWTREGEGLTEKSQLRIIFGEGTANIGFGAMKENPDGSYSYEDLEKVNYSLALNDYSCIDLEEREQVEEILWKNINELSPVSPVLGGKFYVVSMDLDLVSNSGLVVYEDGHIQEKRDFTYEVVDNKVINLKIK